ncbi:hypothetical protein P152DRAFT_227223 [Eremomyces bilateralis CBS 781.70]|uniref:CBM21 domain-containing protein n=1 Tax=Eremomyces bilateralis CBS 781.70 TaxID=1392243 RepID=A0A6G1FR88_9PEZI|nr:uncharacterized protein P152DRAFT_227223 [Eremomyces bilateralis CBS 781.70]KAF1808230.1 hypothetical protein P152DRAFT_227223 [Eremomyces bilateralis CBS 781.70]
MPYTPPSHRSPSSSKSNSPTISRNNSYISPDALSPQEQHKRPHLPRSVTSTSYLQKHRRTPSISDHNDGNKAAMNGSVWSSSSRAGTRSLGPTAANGKLIRSNMASGDPHSSDEEDRRGLKSLAELHHALADIPQRRDPSPDRGTDGSVKSPSGSPVKRPPRPALTPEARKISHSRSSSELALSSLVTNIPDSLIHSTDDSEEDMSVKPPLIRKKSGELVKPALRPASHRRPSSMPGTPTFSKAVHFNDNIEQVRHFLQIDRPIAVSAGSSPVEMYESDAEYPFFSEGGSRPKTYEYEIRLVNWPRDTMERRTQPVWCEKIFLSSDSKMLVGVVAVANLAFNKFVVCRFTLDYWKTTSEVVAEFNNDVRRKYDDGYDRFNFNIKLSDQANLESKTMLLCIRYTVNDQEFWDNNNKMNYSIDFTRKPVSPPKSKAKKGAPVSGSLGAIPRSRHSPASATTQRPYSFPTARNIDDDFGSKFDNMSEFGSFNDAPNAAVLRLKGKPRKAGFLPDDARRRANPSQHGFSNRYDFSASLSAALSNAQSAIGDRSGIQPKGKATQGAPTSSVSPEQQRRILDTKAVGGVPDRGRGRGRPDTLSSEKPDLQSAEYNELIQKYCFVRTPPATRMY